MPESYRNNRVKFNKQGIQKNFVLMVEKNLGLTELELAKKLKVSRRTVWDWTKERITMTHFAAKKMSQWSKLPIPERHSIIDYRIRYQKAGRIGARVKFERYGRVCLNEEYRKEKWRVWWKNIGQYKKPALGFNTIKKIKIPVKSKMLAEFIGILLGDGHIAKYQVKITLSSKEKAYILYVSTVIKKLFDVLPTITKHKKSKAVSLVVSRKSLVDFCQQMGFERGNKINHQVDIPKWIKKNKKFALECIRGLIDTDGCFFSHSYVVNGKRYSYLKLAFTSASAPLRMSVEKILINLEFSVRMSKVRINSNGMDVRIDDAKQVAKYIREIGSHNQKHLDKIKKWKVALNGKAAVC